LREAGHEALLAGGCARDLLLGLEPKDYDVATEAPPERVVELFRATREVGAQFGVVLVRMGGQWIEVATFRRDAEYHDGRRPTHVEFTDAREDAVRRDFTINGMFLDPLEGVVIDYVRGRADLDARLLRAIGDPWHRFAEDHLRLLRAVRFAARLGFAIEPGTAAAIQANAHHLRGVAAERRRDELEKILAHPTRAQALALLEENALLPHLWEGAALDDADWVVARRDWPHLAEDAWFETTMGVLLQNRCPSEIERICRELTCSNQQRETVLWLVQHRASLDDPAAPPLSGLKRLMTHPAFDQLCQIARLRWRERGDEVSLAATLRGRKGAIAPDQVRPDPFVRGGDLASRGLRPGPAYKQLLDRLYERQLDEELEDRADALRALDELLTRDF
jgi:poly(A) polymerase